MASSAPVQDVEMVPPPPSSNVVKTPYKSYKKKFLKLRHQFRDQMRASNQLYEDEQHALRIARRLQEQNDQLLELLLDVNAMPQLPAHLRYDLRSPPPRESEVPELEPDDSSFSLEEVQQAQSVLREMRAELEAGQLSSSEFEKTEAELMAVITRPRSLASLEKTSHTTPGSVRPDHLPDVHEDHPIGYLTPGHEEDFLATLDNHIDAQQATDHPLPQRSKINEREREREVQQKNPMSVFNWLASHRPKELMDDEPPATATEKPAKAPRRASPNPKTGGGTPRAAGRRDKAGGTGAKPEDQEMLDEDGGALGSLGEEMAAPSKKRKRGQADEDVAYRPKGGGGKKRKRTGTRNSNAGVPAAAAASPTDAAEGDGTRGSDL